jgi:hypothetical protein
MSHWLNNTHKKYHGERWKIIKRHLHGTIVDNLDSALIRKRQGESKQEYLSRTDVASYVPHFQRAVLALAGMIIQNEKDAERSWSDGLGSFGDMETPAGRLGEDLDGEGTAWDVVKTQALVDSIGFQEIWTLVEGVDRTGPSQADARSDGSVKTMSPLAVKDWVRDRTGRLIEVKVKSTRDPRTTVKDKPREQDIYTVYKTNGYEIWASEGDSAVNISGQMSPQAEGGTIPYGPNGFQYQTRDGRAALPVYKTEVPVRAPVGYMMALFSEWLFNFRNVRNFHLWSSALARSFIEATDDNGRFDEELFQKVQDLLQEGSRFFPTELGYAAPPMDGAEVRNQTLKDEREDFYSVFFQSYGQVATERTATEIRQDIAQSVGAYLTLQTESLDEWENDMMWRLAQVNLPEASPDTWSDSSIQRNTDFSELSINETLREMRQGAFETGQVPLGATGKAEVAKTWAQAHNIEVDEEEIESATRIQEGREALTERIRSQNGESGDLDL